MIEPMCRICERTDGVELEPIFGFPVCRAHKNIPPMKMGGYKYSTYKTYCKLTKLIEGGMEWDRIIELHQEDEIGDYIKLKDLIVKDIRKLLVEYRSIKQSVLEECNPTELEWLSSNGFRQETEDIVSIHQNI